MLRSFTATLLLDQSWPLDVDHVARALIDRFPTIGKIDSLPGQSEETGLLTIDHAQIVLQASETPIDTETAFPPLRVLRTWDPALAVDAHNAQISVSCGGRLPGLEGGLAYAAATHFVATALAGICKPLAVLWEPARQIVEPGEFAMTAESLLTGTLPQAAWISYAPIAPEGEHQSTATGMVTYGMKAFIGRELELAPRPGDARDAYRCMGAVVRRVMGDGCTLRDGLEMVDREAGITLTVRERLYWLRREESVFVLVAEDSIVDPWTLRQRNLNVA